MIPNSGVYGYQQTRTKPAPSGSEHVPPGQGEAKEPARFQEFDLISRSQKGHHHGELLDLRVNIRENIKHVKTQEQGHDHLEKVNHDVIVSPVGYISITSLP